jgi:short subunit dehydrogenase-like uncharacterized protein
MSGRLLIYGATGYTGRLIVAEALRRGLRPVLAGRKAAALAAMAEELGLASRTVSLDSPDRLATALTDVEVVLHCAGPFSSTAVPMLRACLRSGTHYLDIAGEVGSIEALAQRHAEARQHGIMVLPGVGFDVVPSDCLAAHVAQRLPRATRLRLAIRGLTFITRGSAKTFAEHAGQGIRIRRGGVLATVEPLALQRHFDFGDGPRPAVNVSWGDVASAYYTTGIANIEVYFEETWAYRAMLSASRAFGWALRTAPWQAMLRAQTALLAEGPTPEQRAAWRMTIVAEAEDDAGQHVRARLHTPEAYSFTGMTAAAIAYRVLQGDFEAGFQTPARLYGADFVLSLPGVAREDGA